MARPPDLWNDIRRWRRADFAIVRPELPINCTTKPRLRILECLGYIGILQYEWSVPRQTSRDSNLCRRTFTPLALLEYLGISLQVIAFLFPALNSHPKHACPRKVPLMASTEWMAEEYPALPLFPSGAPLTYLIQEWSLPTFSHWQLGKISPKQHVWARIVEGCDGTSGIALQCRHRRWMETESFRFWCLYTLHPLWLLNYASHSFWKGK